MCWAQLKSKSIDDLIDWAQEQPWAQAMAQCAQDSQWHAEGDVWTHTQLVLKQLPLLDAWQALSADQQCILKFVALFHDAAKPLTTETDAATGRLRSPKHAVKGEQLARNSLRELGCDLGTREAIAKRVRYHGRPVFLSERTEPAHEVVAMSWLVNNQLLHLFAVADARGRHTDDRAEREEVLHYWKLQSEELGCYQQPYPFASEHARYCFFQQSTPNLHYVPHEAFACRVTMMVGVPGSGKDTWLKRNRPELPVVSLDEVRSDLGIDPTDNQGRVAQEGMERCRELLRSGRSFAFNATNSMKPTRDRWLRLFADYNAHIDLVYLEPTLSTMLDRNRSRSDRVPESVIRRLLERVEPPTWAECHRLCIPERC